MPKGETVGNVVIDGKGGSRGRDRKRSKQCKGDREHKKNRDMAVKREAETTNTEAKISESGFK